MYNREAVKELRDRVNEQGVKSVTGLDITMLFDTIEGLEREVERAGRKPTAQEGGYSGGRAPYGYKVEGGKLVIEEKEAEMVRMIFRLLDDGGTLKGVTAAVNEAGYRTRKNGNEFWFSQIRDIRDNRKFYEGMYKYGNMGWVKGMHEAILS